jgi:hypothetical protein
MEDTSKAVAKPRLDDDSGNLGSPEQSSESEASSTFVAYMDDSARSQPAPTQENLTTSAKALDRWFAERQKHQGPPRLLEIPNEALITSAGPINLTGNITLVKEDGSITYANHISLCRCGASKSKPACDNHHLRSSFELGPYPGGFRYAAFGATLQDHNFLHQGWPDHVQGEAAAA